ncbi:MAG: RimK family protein [Myxococcales bacterium]|nr:RimK family protein [Myxococcales bacterium]
MARGRLVVVERPEDWPWSLAGVEVVLARDYLAAPHREVATSGRAASERPAGTIVLNLSRRLGYQKIGYYVSLLADARGHRAWPDVTTIQDLKNRSVLRLLGARLGPKAEAELSASGQSRCELVAFLGRCVDARWRETAAELFERVPAPCLEAVVARDGEGWRFEEISARAIGELSDPQRQNAERAARAFFRAPDAVNGHGESASFELAILVNPADPEPPSDKNALDRIVAAASRHGFRTTFITKDDYARLSQFDALFIRETTGVNHHTYRFARRAEADGLVVIDDPQSIFRCCNKVYLAEALRRARIATPPTLLVDRGRLDRVAATLGLPVVLKAPDSAFSKGVFKADSEREIEVIARRLLERSDLIVAQGFVESRFDWRVGVLDGRALYVCRYYMAEGHWQVVTRDAEGNLLEEGTSDTFLVEDAPPAVVDIGLRAAATIGDGLYGVDIKELPSGELVVVEVNDNPSIEAKVEDARLGDALYDVILSTFLRRLERRRGVTRTASVDR